MNVPYGTIRRIALFRALQLGDMLCAVPAMRALRHAFPAARITLIGLPWASAFVQRFSHYLDEFIAFPGWEGLPEQPSSPQDYIEFRKRICDERFDLLLQMHGNGSIVNSLLTEWNAAITAGFQPEGQSVENAFFMDYPGRLHEIDRHLALLEHLGVPARGRHLEFVITGNDKRALDDLRLPMASRRVIVMHPGSRGTARQWPVEYFALLADYCIEQGFRMVITGVEAERPITARLQALIRYPVIDVAGKTTLGSLAALVKEAHFLISNCTGISHIAAATKTPSLVISLNGEPQRWNPLNHRLHKAIDWTRVPRFEVVFNMLVEHLRSPNVELREASRDALFEKDHTIR